MYSRRLWSLLASFATKLLLDAEKVINCSLRLHSNNFFSVYLYLHSFAKHISYSYAICLTNEEVLDEAVAEDAVVAIEAVDVVAADARDVTKTCGRR